MNVNPSQGPSGGDAASAGINLVMVLIVLLVVVALIAFLFFGPLQGLFRGGSVEVNPPTKQEQPPQPKIKVDMPPQAPAAPAKP